MNKWFTGGGRPIEFRKIIKIIKKHSNNNGTISVGTDSNVKKKKCVFSTAICLHAAHGQNGGRYFISRKNARSDNYSDLLQRITAEVQKSVELGLTLLEYCPTIKVELHLDVSKSDRGEKTSKFSDMLVGYAKGSGFECRVKPDAFAATSVADKHSK